MLVRSKFFLNLSKKLKKFKLSLSKQYNKMLKMRSAMVKIREKSKIIKLGKISQKIFRKFSKIPGKFFEYFLFPGKLKIREKGKPYFQPMGHGPNVDHGTVFNGPLSLARSSISFPMAACLTACLMAVALILGQWFSNWGPRSFWGPRDKFSGTAKHLPKKLKRRS